MSTNGTYVTQREFARLEGTVNEISADVKSLLAAHNRDEGASDVLQSQRDTSGDSWLRRSSKATVAVVAVSLASLGVSLSDRFHL